MTYNGVSELYEPIKDPEYLQYVRDITVFLNDLFVCIQ